MKTKVALTKNKGDLYSIQELDLKELAENEILIKVVASGMCRSDYGERNGNVVPFPNVLGHEGSGIVEKVGTAVKTVVPGDHVILTFDFCSSCTNCHEGHPTACDNWFTINTQGKNKGGEFIFYDGEQGVHNFFNQSSFSTYTIVNENNIAKVPKDIDLRILGPLSCGLGTGSGAVFRALQPKVGSSIIVFGTGAVGFAAIMAAKISGCKNIIAVDIVDSRLKEAKKLGATLTINPTKEKLDEVIQEKLAGAAIEYSIDTTGNIGVMQQAIAVLSSRGTFVPLAVTKQGIELNTFFDLVFPSRKIIGVLIGDMIPKIDLLKLIDFYRRGEFPFDRLIKFYDFEDINKAEKEALSGEVVKAVLIIDKSYTPPQSA